MGPWGPTEGLPPTAPVTRILEFLCGCASLHCTLELGTTWDHATPHTPAAPAPGHACSALGRSAVRLGLSRPASAAGTPPTRSW